MEKIQESNLIDFVKSRKSVKNFIFEKIDKETIREIIECGRWAPSQSNNQPWKINVVTHPTLKRMLADLTVEGGIIENAYVDLVVFLDLERSNNRLIDIQAIGAFMQNILLGVHSKKLGAILLSDIIKHKEAVNEMFKLDAKQYDVMGIIAIGVIDEQMEKKFKKPRERRFVEDFSESF